MPTAATQNVLKRVFHLTTNSAALILFKTNPKAKDYMNYRIMPKLI